MVFLRLTLMLLAGLILLLSLLTWLMARFLLRPPRMTDSKATWVLKRLSPLDIGLSFTPINFSIRDELSKKPLQIAAWWIPRENSDKTVLLLHGYADAKVGAIAWAPLFHELGYNILALDLRAHGESGGTISSGGYWERQDVNQVLNDLRARYPTQTQHVAQPSPSPWSPSEQTLTLSSWNPPSPISATPPRLIITCWASRFPSFIELPSPSPKKCPTPISPPSARST